MSWRRFLQALGVQDPPSLPARLVESQGRLATQTADGHVFVWTRIDGDLVWQGRAEGHGLALDGDRLVLSDGREIDLETGRETQVLPGAPLFVGGRRLILGWKAYQLDEQRHVAPQLDLSSQLHALVQGDRVHLLDAMRDAPGVLDLGTGTVSFAASPEGPVMDGCLHQGKLACVQRARVRLAGELLPQEHSGQALAVGSHRGQLVSVGLGPGPELRVRGAPDALELPELGLQPRIHSLDAGLLVQTRAGFWFRADDGQVTTLSLPGEVGVLLPLQDQVVVGRRPCAIHRLADATCSRLLADPAVPT